MTREFTIAEIADAIGGQAVGDAELRVSHASEPTNAQADALALAMSPKYAEALSEGNARAAMLWGDADWQELGLEAAVLVSRPRYAMSSMTRLMDPGHDVEQGIHATSIVHPTARIGPDAAVGPFVLIGANVEIGSGATISSHVSIAENASIGKDSLILQGVRIGARVRIGANFIAQPGAVIGADGFSFVTPQKSGVEKARESLGDQGEKIDQSWTRIHSLGSVTIGNNVEIGANSTVDRGTVRNTSVADGSKLDNLVHLGHNVQVGRDCLLCGQVGVAGSVKIGDRVVLGGQVGVSDNIFVGDDVIAGGGTKIMSNAPAGRVLLGYPAVKMDTQIEMQKAMRRLPRFMKQAREEK